MARHFIPEASRKFLRGPARQYGYVAGCSACALLRRTFTFNRRGIMKNQGRRRGLGLTAAVLLFAMPVTAQTPPVPEARPEDVASIDAILAALYDVISGPAGQKRDWDRFQSLFAPGVARLIPTGRRQDGTVGYRALTPAEYQAGSAPALEGQGFFEKEIHRVADTFGNITQVFSTYESRRTPDAQPFSRGINSIQLLNDGKRFWVVTIFWDSERANNPIPARYLKSGT